jgi:hypothetical protein
MTRSASSFVTRLRKSAVWLGVFAICLTVFMPLLTQWVGAPEEPAICSASHGAPTAPDEGSSKSVQGFDHCGYCSLTAHTPFVASGDQAMAVFAPPKAITPLAASTSVRAGRRYPRAQPRAPPAA